MNLLRISQKCESFILLAICLRIFTECCLMLTIVTLTPSCQGALSGLAHDGTQGCPRKVASSWAVQASLSEPTGVPSACCNALLGSLLEVHNQCLFI